jgi:hypothetical protein
MSDDKTNKLPEPPKWQMRLLWVVAIGGLLIISAPLFEISWLMPAAFFFWFGFNAMAMPRTMTGWRTLFYFSQLLITAIVMMVLVLELR